jgi:hypothetical protein
VRAAPRNEFLGPSFGSRSGLRSAAGGSIPRIHDVVANDFSINNTLQCTFGALLIASGGLNLKRLDSHHSHERTLNKHDISNAIQWDRFALQNDDALVDPKRCAVDPILESRSLFLCIPNEVRNVNYPDH